MLSRVQFVRRSLGGAPRPVRHATQFHILVAQSGPIDCDELIECLFQYDPIFLISDTIKAFPGGASMRVVIILISARFS
jgi:hypothetical protein